VEVACVVSTISNILRREIWAVFYMDL